MRYWILVTLLNGLLTMIIDFGAPEMFGSKAYYIGGAICALVSMVITWHDPPDKLNNVLFFLFKLGVLAAGLAFFVWGVGYGLAIWGDHNPDELVSSAFDILIPDMALLAGIVILCGILVHIRNR
ncbi:hypothetical protein ACHCAI_004524 [Enterobacter asburiae]